MQFKYQHSFYNILLILMSIAKCSSCHAPHGCWLTVAFTTDHDTNHVHLIIVTLTYMYVVWRGDKTTVELGGRPWSPNPPPPPGQGNRGESPWPHLFVVGLIQGKIPKPRPCLWVHDGSRLHKHVGTYGMHVQCMFACTSMSCHRDVNGYKF